MNIEVKSIKELIEFRDKLNEVIALAEELELEVISSDFVDNTKDDEFRVINGSKNSDLKSVKDYIIEICKQYNAFSVEIKMAERCFAYSIFKKIDSITVYYNESKRVFYIRGISDAELEEIIREVEFCISKEE